MAAIEACWCLIFFHFVIRFCLLSFGFLLRTFLLACCYQMNAESAIGLTGAPQEQPLRP